MTVNSSLLYHKHSYKWLLSFVSSCLAYCNSLDLLQLVHNTAVRLLTKLPEDMSNHSHFGFLRLAPVKFMIQFKTLVITYGALHGQAPVLLHLAGP